MFSGPSRTVWVAPVVGALLVASLAATLSQTSRAEAATAARSVRCTLWGTSGDDLLVGTGRDEVVCGRGGDDQIWGGGGKDVLRGGRGDDVLRGGEVLYGGRGADDLYRGVMFGGPGADFCVGDDRRGGCEADTESPVMAGDHFSAATVNVTETDRVVVVFAHLTDDLGVGAVNLDLIDGDLQEGYSHEYPWQPYRNTARLRSGTPRDGVWSLRVRIPRYASPGAYRIVAKVFPRRGPEVTLSGDRKLTVRSDRPDREPPALVQMMRPAVGATVRRSETLTARARVTDALAGVELVMFCYRPVSGVITGFCSWAKLVGGDRHDGIWSARMPMGDMPLGEAEVDVKAVDRTGLDDTWWGPAQVEALNGLIHPIPGGYGPFTVIR
jgi:RTX calcium-binding nonapeptide repeat (4 copies)